MSDPEVQVSIEGSADTITVDTGDPIITIIEPAAPAETIVIAPESSTTIITDEYPRVNINYDFSDEVGKTALIELLNDSLDITQFTPELAADIELVQDLWIRIGDDIEQILIDADVSSITGISQTYTDTQIATIAVDIQLLEDGINANTSYISQTADDINLRVTGLEQSTDSEFTAQSARIDINQSGITSTVSRVDALLSEDQTTGIIKTLESAITQTSDRVTIEVADREALANGPVTENTTNVTQTAESLVAVVETNNQLIGRADSAEVRLTATEQVTSILSESLGETQYSLQTTQAITANSYGVTIEETVGGIPYVAGFELILHPAWTLGSGGIDFLYAVDDVVSYTDTYVYRCILEHYSSVDNSPGSAAWATYWELVSESAQTEFNVQADHFSVITPGGLVPMLDVDGGTGEVSINADLLISGSLQSSNYAAQNPAESWYKLDHSIGSAEFNNITMSFTSSTEQDAFKAVIGVDQDIADLQSQIDGNITTWFLTGVPTLVNLPASDWTTDEEKNVHLGDLYYDDATGYSYRFQLVTTVYSWVRITDSDITAAIANAAAAQDTADGKRRVFVVTPSGPYDIGDLWDNSGSVYRATANRATGYLAGEWTLVGDVTSTVIQGGLITTGAISNHATTPTLEIDFNAAEINVNSTGSLQINAATGVEVNSGGSIIINDGGGIEIDGGGDLLLNSETGNPATINFETGGSGIASFSVDSVYASALVLLPNTDSFQTFLIGSISGSLKWEQVIIDTSEKIAITAYDTSTINVSMTTEIEDVSGVDHCVFTAESHSGATRYSSIETRAQPSEGSVEIDASDSILNSVSTHTSEMYNGLAIHRGLRSMADTTTYDSLIPDVGDFYYYILNTSGILRIRQRRTTGYISRTAMS